MPRLSTSLPKYRRHSDGRNAIVELSGKVFYLGRHGSKSSKAKYDELIALWLGNGRRLPTEKITLSINQLVLKYLQHANEYYRKNGELTREYGLIKESVAVMVAAYGSTPVGDFGPKKLKVVRQQMIERQNRA